MILILLALLAPFGMMSLSDPVDPVGLCGTLSPSDSTHVGPVGPFGLCPPLTMLARWPVWDTVPI